MERDYQEQVAKARAYNQGGMAARNRVSAAFTKEHNAALKEMAPIAGTARRIGEAYEEGTHSGMSYEFGQKLVPAAAGVATDATLVAGVASKTTQLARAGESAAGSAPAAAQPRSWTDFLPEAEQRLQAAKAQYGDLPLYAMDEAASPSAILRANMKAAGVRPPPFPNAAHHIVAVEARAAAPARAHLLGMGIDLNEASNGVFMRYTEKGIGPNHLEIHTGAYYEEINARVLATQTAGEARSALQSIGNQISAGTFPF
jgi:hypothetical protein